MCVKLLERVRTAELSASPFPATKDIGKEGLRSELNESGESSYDRSRPHAPLFAQSCLEMKSFPGMRSSMALSRRKVEIPTLPDVCVSRASIKPLRKGCALLLRIFFA